jgi:3-hydroxyacyl-CoA dehydrogenase
MTKLVTYDVRDRIALIAVDNPPVNALSGGVAEALSAAVERAAGDAEARAIVVMGAGRTFVAGADIAVLEEMAWGAVSGAPAIHDLLRKIEDSPKPVVMAIHGTALGGGLELAMAGHYRVAVATAQVGQPEVNLGIIPGAEGTQRLPRLVGIERAIEMCVSGKPLSAADALAAGLLDRIIDGDLAQGAIEFAGSVTRGRKTRERTERLGTAEANAPLYEAGRQLAAKIRKKQQAPLLAIEAIEAAAALPFDEGCRRERELFQQCVVSDQAKSLIHAFFAERAAAKVPGVEKASGRPVQCVGIVGAGTMGGGIAMACANAGVRVILCEADETALTNGVGRVRQNYETSVKRGRFTPQQVEERMALIQPQLKLDGFEQADVIIEAVFENMAVKKEVFRRLDAVARPDCIVASNTSTLDIDEIASVTRRPESVVGLHFFSPANVMRLLEIVRGRATSGPVLAAALAFARQLKKVGVVAGNCPGFIGNRMFFGYMYEAQFLVEEGATPQQVDRALTNFGMAMGIFAVDDLAGIDVAWRVRQEMKHFAEPGTRRPLVQDRLFEMGRYGQKTGKGWYLYGDDRKAVADPEVEALIERSAREAGTPQRQISDAEIVERCVYSLVNEGARLLDEGFALRASDIDVVYLNGYGFPSWRGGPMFYAGLTGLGAVLDRIRQFEREHGPRWTPAPLLVRLANEGRTFRDFDKERQ